MNGFTRKKVMSLTLGEKLGQIRAERRMSLNEVSRGTRIQSKYIQYLESGEYDKLPARVYVRGFLRSYAVFMGINESPLIKAYERELKIQSSIKREREVDEKNEARKPFAISTFAITPKVITLASAIILIAGAFFYVYKELNNFVSTPVLIVSSPTDNETVDSGQINVVGRSEKDGKVFVNDQLVVVNDKGEFSESVSLRDGLNAITIRATNRFEKETVKKLSVYFDNKNLESENFEQPVEVKSFPVADKIDLEVGSIDEPIWVSIEADGKLVFSGTLQVSSWHKITAQKEAVVSSGKGNKTLIKINNQDKGVLSDDAGPVKDISFKISDF